MPSIFCFDVQNRCYESKIPSPPSTTSGIGKENNSARVALQVIRKKWASPKKKPRDPHDMPKPTMLVRYDEPPGDSRRKERQRCLRDILCSLWHDSWTLPQLTAVGFEPTPLRNGALSHRLRPLGQPVLEQHAELWLILSRCL